MLLKEEAAILAVWDSWGEPSDCVGALVHPGDLSLVGNKLLGWQGRAML